MLPFLQAKKIGSVIVSKHKPDGSQEVSHEEGESKPHLMAAAESLIRAVHSKDPQAVADALEDAFYSLDDDSGMPAEAESES